MSKVRELVQKQQDLVRELGVDEERRNMITQRFNELREKDERFVNSEIERRLDEARASCFEIVYGQICGHYEEGFPLSGDLILTQLKNKHLVSPGLDAKENWANIEKFVTNCYQPKDSKRAREKMDQFKEGLQKIKEVIYPKLELDEAIEIRRGEMTIRAAQELADEEGWR